MKAWNLKVFAAAGVLATLLVLFQIACVISTARAAVSFDAATPPAAVLAAHFPEPLVATSATSSAEDFALSQAVTAYEERTKPDDVSSLTAFLFEYPHSGWASAVLTNLGLAYLHHGYFSQALDAWQRAWIEGNGASEPRARALVDRSIGELARLYADLGHVESLSELFDQIGDRAVTGSATEAVQTAREQLALVHKDPRHLFICGPMSLLSLMLAQGAVPDQVRFLQRYRAGPNGTSLAEVARLAESANLRYRLVFRQPGQPVPIPAIAHWKVGHFAAIIGEANGRYRVADPVFAGHTLWIAPDALDTEASGYFLVPAIADDGQWREVGEAEAGGIWGKGATFDTKHGDDNDPPAAGPSGPSGPGGPPGPNAPAPDCGGTCCSGMCGYNIKESSVSLTLSDTPVGYTPPIGPSAKTLITYNQREDSQPQGHLEQCGVFRRIDRRRGATVILSHNLS